MIVYTRKFSGSYSNKLEQGFFEFFSGYNVINRWVKNTVVSFESNNELPNNSASVKNNSFFSRTVENKVRS